MEVIWIPFRDIDLGIHEDLAMWHLPMDQTSGPSVRRALPESFHCSFQTKYPGLHVPPYLSAKSSFIKIHFVD